MVASFVRRAAREQQGSMEGAVDPVSVPAIHRGPRAQSSQLVLVGVELLTDHEREMEEMLGVVKDKSGHQHRTSVVDVSAAAARRHSIMAAGVEGDLFEHHAIELLKEEKARADAFHAEMQRKIEAESAARNSRWQSAADELERNVFTAIRVQKAARKWRAFALARRVPGTELDANEGPAGKASGNKALKEVKGGGTRKNKGAAMGVGKAGTAGRNGNKAMDATMQQIRHVQGLMDAAEGWLKRQQYKEMKANQRVALKAMKARSSLRNSQRQSQRVRSQSQAGAAQGAEPQTMPFSDAPEPEEGSNPPSLQAQPSSLRLSRKTICFGTDASQEARPTTARPTTAGTTSVQPIIARPTTAGQTSAQPTNARPTTAGTAVSTSAAASAATATATAATATATAAAAAAAAPGTAATVVAGAAAAAATAGTTVTTEAGSIAANQVMAGLVSNAAAGGGLRPALELHEEAGGGLRPSSLKVHEEAGGGLRPSIELHGHHAASSLMEGTYQPSMQLPGHHAASSPVEGTYQPSPFRAGMPSGGSSSNSSHNSSTFADAGPLQSSKDSMSALSEAQPSGRAAQSLAVPSSTQEQQMPHPPPDAKASSHASIGKQPVGGPLAARLGGPYVPGASTAGGEQAAHLSNLTTSGQLQGIRGAELVDFAACDEEPPLYLLGPDPRVQAPVLHPAVAASQAGTGQFRRRAHSSMESLPQGFRNRATFASSTEPGAQAVALEHRYSQDTASMPLPKLSNIAQQSVHARNSQPLPSLQDSSAGSVTSGMTRRMSQQDTPVTGRTHKSSPALPALPAELYSSPQPRSSSPLGYLDGVLAMALSDESNGRQGGLGGQSNANPILNQGQQQRAGKPVGFCARPQPRRSVADPTSIGTLVPARSKSVLGMAAGQQVAGDDRSPPMRPRPPRGAKSSADLYAPSVHRRSSAASLGSAASPLGSVSGSPSRRPFHMSPLTPIALTSATNAADELSTSPDPTAGNPAPTGKSVAFAPINQRPQPPGHLPRLVHTSMS